MNHCYRSEEVISSAFSDSREKIEAVSCDARVEPFLDRPDAAEVYFYLLGGVDQYHEYDRLDTVSFLNML